MGNTFSLVMIIEIENCYELSDKVELKDPIALRPRAQCDGKANQCSGNLDLATFEMNNPAILNFADDVSDSVFDGRQTFRKRSLANLKARRGRGHIQRFVRSIVVVFETPLIKLLLRL